MNTKEEMIKESLKTKDESKQIKLIRKMSKRISTAKLKRGYRNLKHSKKVADIKAREVIKEELLKRGERV